jgi:IPT/TIG domain
MGLTGVASATTTKSTAPTFTKCSPATVTLGKTVTIHGTNLAGATLTIDGTIVATTKTTAKTIKATVPLDGVPAKSDPIEIATSGGTVEGHCTFKAGKAPKP